MIGDVSWSLVIHLYHDGYDPWEALGGYGFNFRSAFHVIIQFSFLQASSCVVSPIFIVGLA